VNPQRDGAATLAAYAAEMTRAGLLSAEEERTLATAIRAGRRASAVVLEPGDGEGELRVREAIEAGLDARRQLVCANHGWVITLARRARGGIVSIDELLQAGVIGLLLAVEHFDPSRGRFTTYATFLVRQEIHRAIEDAGPGLRLRLKVRQEAAQVHAARHELRPLLGRAASPPEIAAATGLSEAAVRRVLPLGASPVPLDADDRPVDAVLEDPRARVEEEVMARARAAAARVLLGALTPHQQQVVRLRFGLDDGEERNRAEVGRMLRVSRERVRQIEVEALARLKRAAQARGLAELVG
jgi:RNA polymerase nonessential primary-like sigma factor